MSQDGVSSLLPTVEQDPFNNPFWSVEVTIKLRPFSQPLGRRDRSKGGSLGSGWSEEGQRPCMVKCRSSHLVSTCYPSETGLFSFGDSRKFPSSLLIPFWRTHSPGVFLSVGTLVGSLRSPPTQRSHLSTGKLEDGTTTSACYPVRDTTRELYYV